MRRCCWISALVGAVLACGRDPAGRAGTVLYASGSELQSINPLFTVHPLARQVQRYVFLTTLVRYDSMLQVQPYLARRWSWSRDRRVLTLRLFPRLRWHDGVVTTANDAAWTLDLARDPAIGYPRQGELAALESVAAPDDTTLMLRFVRPQARIPDVLTDLAILPRHLLGGLPRTQLRGSPWERAPVGNGPFRFVAHEANRRWVFARNEDFPAELGGPPELERLVIAVVDEPLTKLAALAAGELDIAGIQPAHASYVRGDSMLRVADYPLLFSTVILFNTRRPLFASLESRRAVAAGLDRRALVQGTLYGYGTPADGPVPPAVSGFAAEPNGGGVKATGQPTGLDFDLLTVGSGEAALEQMIQSQLAAHGVTVRIRQLELSAFLDRVYGPAHDFDAALLGIPGDLGMGHLAPLASLSGLRPPGELNALLRFYADSIPATFVYHARGLQGLNRRLEGVELGIRGELASVTRWRVDRP